jgi:hypothetical protein
MTTCAELVVLRWKHLTHMFPEPPQSLLAGLYQMTSFYPSAHRLSFLQHTSYKIFISLVHFFFFLFFRPSFFFIKLELKSLDINDRVHIYIYIYAKASAFSRESDGATENAMAYHVSHTGPVVACVDATKFNSYVGGVVSACGGDVNHCLQVCVCVFSGQNICVYLYLWLFCFLYVYVI